jgi:argininosuccinate synthase
MGIKEIYIEDLREEFVRDFVFPMFRANALYEGSICSAPRSRGR